MKRIRIDVYGGYAGEDKPDPDHKYTWKQLQSETAQDYLERLIEYLTDIVYELDDNNEDDEDD